MRKSLSFYSVFKKVISVFICLTITAALVPATAFMQPEKSAEAASIKPSLEIMLVNTGKLTIAKGSSYKLGAKASKGAKLTYKSSKKSVITVSKKGVLKAKNLGKSTITIKAKRCGKTATKKVKVTVVKKSKYKKVKKISVKVSKTKLTIGQSAKTKIKFKPSNASNKNVIYQSSNPSVLSVSNKGVITAKSVGSAKVWVASCDPSWKHSKYLHLLYDKDTAGIVCLGYKSVKITVGESPNSQQTLY